MEIDGKGIELQRGDGGAPEVFTAIAQTTQQGQSGQEREIHDVTAHDTVGNRRKKVGGLVDSGDYEVELWYDPADHPLSSPISTTSCRGTTAWCSPTSQRPRWNSRPSCRDSNGRAPSTGS